MHRLLIQVPIAVLLLAALAVAQQQTPPDRKPQTPPVGQEPAKQEPAKQDPAKQDPAKQDPAKTEQSKPGETPKDGAKPKDGEAPKDGTKPKDGEKREGDTEVDLPEDTPLPDTGDPADLRAMRSAQEMVAAERRMRALIKAGKIKDIDKLVSFEEISSWPYEDGLKGVPKAIRALDGKSVLMTGFMLPIDEVENIREFLLVQSLWACCYGQPPDINGIVRVVMKGDKRVDYQFDPIQVQGQFKVEEMREDGYCIDIFQLHADQVSLIK